MYFILFSSLLRYLIEYRLIIIKTNKIKMHKIKFSFSVSVIALILFLSSCKKDDASPSPGGSLGTYAGSIQVTDDPVTKLGYIYNAKVAVSTSGSTITVKVTGDLSFDREYTGTITTSQSGQYYSTLTKQTKPTDKTVGGSIIILGNELAITVNSVSDNVNVKDPNTSQNISITGKVGMIGTNLIKQ